MHPQQDVVSVPEALQEIEQLDGFLVCVRGMLVVPAQGVYLVDLAEPVEGSIAQVWQSADRLELEEPGLVDRLYAGVPAWGGGPFSYRDEAFVVGRLVRRPNGGLSLTEIVGLTVVRQGRRYEIRFDR
ncbi:hypothetical protein [Streptomyces sp. NPDC056468]|uniref:hypothetical protein n=1 Tax=Streptomyces sp. NPDC056468 TaxID=3345830 RepID=UPI00369BE0A0